jgi:hypothetical protein
MDKSVIFECSINRNNFKVTIMKKSLILSLLFVFALAVSVPVSAVAADPVKKETTTTDKKECPKTKECSTEAKKSCCGEKAKACCVTSEAKTSEKKAEAKK